MAQFLFLAFFHKILSVENFQSLDHRCDDCDSGIEALKLRGTEISGVKLSAQPMPSHQTEKEVSRATERGDSSDGSTRSDPNEDWRTAPGRPRLGQATAAKARPWSEAE
jgi:hypothetical protein